jgi:NNP family nitrate/nitrite transporter-like MFS transporter
VGGTRALGGFFSVAGGAMIFAAVARELWLCGAAFFVASGAFGMGNGAVFQLLPQRFAKEIGVMTGLVGCGGGIGGFVLGMLFGYSKASTGSYVAGILLFAALCGVALAGLKLVTARWRMTWGALAAARI